MNDVTCPYCSAEQDINHDDGYGYDEDDEYEQYCIECDKPFEFTTSISFSYTVYCKEGDHSMQPMGDKFPGMYECTNCEFIEERR